MLEKIIKNPKYRPFLAFFCAAGWSLAYPLIKLGYSSFQIASDDVGSKILFAGIRFFTAGVIVSLFAGKKNGNPFSKEIPWGLLIAFSLINTTLHYLFSYVGLGYLPSSRATIIDSTNSFMLIIFACILFADEYLTLQKAIGCILGFLGIVMINITPGQSLFEGMSLRGDGSIFLNALCGACGGLLPRFLSKKMDMTVATGLSMAIGGGVLCLIGLVVGPAAMWHVSLEGIIILAVLILISAVCFDIFNLLLSYHPIGKVAIFNAFIPVLGVIFSNLLLNEPFKAKYVIACVIVALGVVIVNLELKKQEN